MTDRDRNEIWRIAEDIVNLNGISIPIQNMEEVIRDIGGEILYGDNLLGVADGYIEKMENNSFKIVLSNSNATRQRENFTVSHELGHLFLHMGFGTQRWDMVEVGKKYHRDGNTEEEMQANEFAAAFLMPRDRYREALERFKNKENDTIDISRVAQHFNVSIEAAHVRGKWLGYFAW